MLGAGKVQTVRGGLYSHCRDVERRGPTTIIENRRCMDRASAQLETTEPSRASDVQASDDDAARP